MIWNRLRYRLRIIKKWLVICIEILINSMRLMNRSRIRFKIKLSMLRVK